MNKKKYTLMGYLFFLPFGALFVIFKIYPFIKSMKMGFYKWDIFGTPKFIGFENFTRMFRTERFWTSLWHTLYFTILTVPPLVILGFLIALLLNSKIKFRGFFRAAFYVPYILSISVVCLTWKLMLNSNFGILNKIIGFFGFEGLNWLNDPKTAMIAIALTTIWWTIGFNIIVYLSAIQQIPSSYYEAATLDGANAWKRLFHITIPLLKSTHVLVIVLQVIYSLQIFGQVYIMTAGGPGGKTRTIVQYIYENGFKYFKMGYAQAVATIFFLLMIGISIIQIKLMTRKDESI